MNSGTLVDRNLEAGRGAKVAVRCAGAELTYAQLHDRICRAGNALSGADPAAELKKANDQFRPILERSEKA